MERKVLRRNYILMTIKESTSRIKPYFKNIYLHLAQNK